jgi:hypothetical protein
MRPWLKLVFYFLLVWSFIYLMPFFLNKIPSYTDVIQKSETLGIDNSALFYSEEPLTSRAELELNERLNSIQE